MLRLIPDVGANRFQLRWAHCESPVTSLPSELGWQTTASIEQARRVGLDLADHHCHSDPGWNPDYEMEMILDPANIYQDPTFASNDPTDVALKSLLDRFRNQLATSLCGKNNVIKQIGISIRHGLLQSPRGILSCSALPAPALRGSDRLLGNNLGLTPQASRQRPFRGSCRIFKRCWSRLRNRCQTQWNQSQP